MWDQCVYQQVLWACLLVFLDWPYNERKFSILLNAMITIYHNPRCSKSRQTLEILQSEKVDLNIVLYLETPIDKPTLTSLLAKLNMAPREIIRRTESEFKENKLGAPEVTDEQLINAMIQYPKLIERPIVVSDNKAVIGRPPENVREIM